MSYKSEIRPRDVNHAPTLEIWAGPGFTGSDHPYVVRVVRQRNYDNLVVRARCFWIGADCFFFDDFEDPALTRAHVQAFRLICAQEL